MYQPPSQYNVTVTVAPEDGELPDPVAFAVEADRAAWRRSAGIVSAHMTDRIISIVTVYAPDRHAAVAVANAVVSDALRRLDPSADAARPGTGRNGRHPAEPTPHPVSASPRPGDGRGQLPASPGQPLSGTRP